MYEQIVNPTHSLANTTQVICTTNAENPVVSVTCQKTVSLPLY